MPRDYEGRQGTRSVDYTGKGKKHKTTFNCCDTQLPMYCWRRRHHSIFDKWLKLKETIATKQEDESKPLKIVFLFTCVNHAGLECSFERFNMFNSLRLMREHVFKPTDRRSFAACQQMTVILWLFSWLELIQQFHSFTSPLEITVFHSCHTIYTMLLQLQHSNNTGRKTGACGVRTERMNNEHTLFSHWVGSAH